jgi:trafficking protein particle complex subunit 3
MSTAKQYKAIGEDLWKSRTDKIVRLSQFVPITVRQSDSQEMQNAELFTMAYGSLVVQLIQDYEDYAEVNKQLEKMYVHSP